MYLNNSNLYSCRAGIYKFSPSFCPETTFMKRILYVISLKYVNNNSYLNNRTYIFNNAV